MYRKIRAFHSEQENLCTSEKTLDLITDVYCRQPLLGSENTPNDGRPVDASSKIQFSRGNIDFGVDFNLIPHMSLPVCQELGPVLQDSTLAENMFECWVPEV